MINLTRLNGAEIVVNANALESLEATPDTVLSLTSGQKLVVRETISQVVEKVIRYQRRVHTSSPVTIRESTPASEAEPPTGGKL